MQAIWTQDFTATVLDPAGLTSVEDGTTFKVQFGALCGALPLWPSKAAVSICCEAAG